MIDLYWVCAASAKVCQSQVWVEQPFAYRSPREARGSVCCCGPSAAGEVSYLERSSILDGGGELCSHVFCPAALGCWQRLLAAEIAG